MYCDSSFGCAVFKSCHFSNHQDQVYSKETKLGSNNQEVPILAVKCNREVLVPCLTWKRVPTAISGGVDILDVPGCQLLHEVSF